MGQSAKNLLGHQTLKVEVNLLKKCVYCKVWGPLFKSGCEYLASLHSPVSLLAAFQLYFYIIGIPQDVVYLNYSTVMYEASEITVSYVLFV